MFHQHSSVSTQDIRREYERKDSVRSRKTRHPKQEPSMNDSRYLMYTDKESYISDTAGFTRSDAKRKSTFRLVTDFFRRRLRISQKDKRAQLGYENFSTDVYRHDFQNGYQVASNTGTPYSQRRGSVRGGARSLGKTGSRSRSSSGGTQSIQRPRLRDKVTDDIDGRTSQRDYSLKRNNSLTTIRTSGKTHLMNSESAPDSFVRSADERASRHGNHQRRLSRSGSSRTFAEDAESGFDSPTGSNSIPVFLPSVPCVTGLPNLGNTCYMNSILQCLSVADTLAEYFVTNAYRKDLKFKSLDGIRSNSVAVAFHKVLKALWCNEPSEQCIQDFRSAIALYNDVYAANYQQDAQELLVWLLDRLHEELDIPSSWNSSDLTEQRFEESSALKRNEHRSAITNIFSACFLSSVECMSCHFRTTKPDPFTCVSLQVPEQETPVFITLARLRKPQKLFCLGLKVKMKGKIKDVEECISRGFIDSGNLVIVTQLSEFGFTFLDRSTTIRNLDRSELFAIEMTPSSRDKIAIVFVVVDSSGNGERDHGVPITQPFVCSVSRFADYQEICNLLLEAIQRCRESDYNIRFPDLRSFQLVVFDGWRKLFYLDPCASKPLCNDPVNKSLVEISNEYNESTLILQLLLMTRNISFLSWVISEYRETEFHPSYQTLKDLGASTTLTDCLKEYTHPEPLVWTCGNCEGKHGEKTMQFESLPEVLLKDGSMGKLARKIDYPTAALNMSPFISQEYHEYGEKTNEYSTRQQQNRQPRATTDAVYVDVNMDNVYDLFGIVHHMGTSTDSGHYTATTKNPIDGKWRYFDDTVVQEVTSPTTIESSTVYLLFYERRSARRQINCSSSGHSSTESGIQEHWFNRIAVSLTAKSKWTNLRTNQQFNDDEEEPKLSASKDASLAVGSRQFQAKNELLAGNFQRNEFVRNNRSPSVLAPQYQSQISKNYLTRTDSTAQNVWF
ncbi:unnamed protein product [Enterobius vermicularis]|uniref:Ubiquitin carboxyl-terminal hydrolase n=1 Tax=Enterobius vermicularis TaxID=51028 RepID=A0A158QAC9_ENTVE|nr:unnamed protein product [Enterobius vermicularis]